MITPTFCLESTSGLWPKEGIPDYSTEGITELRRQKSEFGGTEVAKFPRAE